VTTLDGASLNPKTREFEDYTFIFSRHGSPSGFGKIFSLLEVQNYPNKLDGCLIDFFQWKSVNQNTPDLKNISAVPGGLDRGGLVIFAS
jgi:hypothetical protein